MTACLAPPCRVGWKDCFPQKVERALQYKKQATLWCATTDDNEYPFMETNDVMQISASVLFCAHLSSIMD